MGVVPFMLVGIVLVFVGAAGAEGGIHLAILPWLGSAFLFWISYRHVRRERMLSTGNYSDWKPKGFLKGVVWGFVALLAAILGGVAAMMLDLSMPNWMSNIAVGLVLSGGFLGTLVPLAFGIGNALLAATAKPLSWKEAPYPLRDPVTGHVTWKFHSKSEKHPPMTKEDLRAAAVSRYGTIFLDDYEYDENGYVLRDEDGNIKFKRQPAQATP